MDARVATNPLSKLFRIVSFLRSSENVKATLEKARTALQNVKATVAAMETAAVQDLVQKADRGEVHAQFDCGEQYYFGSSVPQDYQEAARWFQRAAERGHSQAQCNLGMMYAVGRGVERDDVEALKWVLLAVGRGNKSALKIQEKLVRRLNPEQATEARSRAEEFQGRRRVTSTLPNPMPPVAEP